MRLAIYTVLMVLATGPALANEEPVAGGEQVRGVAEKIAQKIRMINQILENSNLNRRAEESTDRVARELMARAAENLREGETYFAREQFLEADAVLDYVLRDLGASARLLSAPRLKSSEYHKFIEQLDAFELPEWSGLGEMEIRELEQTLERVSALRRDAMMLAREKSFEQAIDRLEQAYRLMVSLLDRFEHQTTIVYDLNFDTIQDEYSYQLNRTYHFLDMVQLALSTREAGEQTRELTDRYVYRAMDKLGKAESDGAQGRYEEAIPVLSESIDDLSAALKLLGVRI